MEEPTNDKEFNQESTQHLDGMYEDWFLDYASYVILERAVPNIYDGLKPVQRRIMHSMKEMDDGRYHKVANIIGQTMQYHPHGDAAIGDALVNLGQKDLLIDCQGNWGDNRTGDRAAAARYIEARLSKFALAIAFNKDTTDWQMSYDGRKNEPIILPVKFPLLLAQGAEGIAVGLSTKILPHNFIELIKASIDSLKGKKVKIFPDFHTGGLMDVSEYNQGKRGGRVKVRAIIEVKDKKTLLVKQIPFGTTTSSIIDSIVKANDKGKIKIKKVVDNTAKHVEIQIDLPNGVSPDVTVDALYAFTQCENSISPNACIILEDKPHFMSVDDILRISSENTKELLRQELEIKKADLENKWHFSSLEKIFIENRIYRDIEEEETWEGVISAIDKGLDPHKKLLKREVTEDDIVRLTEIKIKRISKFDAFKADELINKLEEELAQVEHDLAHLTDFAIAYFQNLLEKFGKGKERKTEIRTFDQIAVRQVAAANKKLYANYKEGFIGTSLRQDEFIAECSDIDDIIAIRKDGKMMVTRVGDKKFVGKDIIYCSVWKKGDDRRIYHLVYLDSKSKRNYVKRFAITSITRDKEYDLTKGNSGSKVVYLTVQPNSESEIVNVQLSQGARAKIKTFDFDFAELAIKGRGSQGNILTKYPVRKIEQKQLGESTLGGIDIWLDKTVGRLNKEERGDLLGNFDTGDHILVIYKDGSYEMTDFEMTNRYAMADIHSIEKHTENTVISTIYLDGDSKNHLVKRFQIETNVQNKRYPFITEHRNSKLVICSTADKTFASYTIVKGKAKEKVDEEIELGEFIDVKGWKSLGNRLSQFPVAGKIKMREEHIEPTELASQPEPVEGLKTEKEPTKISPDSSEEHIEDKKTKEASTPSKSQPKPASQPEPVEGEETEDSFEVGSTIDLSSSKPKKIDDKGGESEQGQLF